MNKEGIREDIQDVICELIDIEKIIENMDLTNNEKKWAHEHVDWKVYILGE